MPLWFLNAIAGPSAFLAISLPGLYLRRWTARRRTLPSVFILGAPKAGTTSLASHIAKHPSYVSAHNKELMFLQELPDFKTNYETNRLLYYLWGNYAQGVDSYRKLFPLESTMRRVTRRTGATAVTGDHTPFYLYCPTAMERVRELSPAAKLIVLLRDPVSRAFSDYKMHRNRELEETRTFERAIDEELSGACRDFRRRYLAQGIYAPHLRMWLNRFPREQFLILDCSELFKDAAAVIERTYDFLGLPSFAPEKLPVKNKGRLAVSMKDETRAKLQDYFKPHNRELYDLLGNDLGWDRPRPASSEASSSSAADQSRDVDPGSATLLTSSRH